MDPRPNGLRVAGMTEREDSRPVGMTADSRNITRAPIKVVREDQPSRRWTREKLLRLGLAVIARDPELKALVREVQVHKKFPPSCTVLVGALLVAHGRVTASQLRSILVKKGLVASVPFAGIAGNHLFTGPVGIPATSLRSIIFR